MDFLKQGQQMMNSGQNQNQPINQQQQPQQGGNQQAGNNSNEDYGDKALDFAEKKSGHTLGRDTNEKITDGARGVFEKFSGKQVDSKYSN